MRSVPLLLLSALVTTGQAQTVLIHGVPYVSWHEAAKVAIDSGPVYRNPSILATQAMLRAYWTIDQSDQAPDTTLLACCTTTGELRVDSATSFDVLKPLLASGRPVVVDLALTADGHVFSPNLVFGRKLGLGPKVKWPEGVASSMLGAVMPLWVVDSFRAALSGFSPVYETLIAARRIVIGYDETRRVVIVHDPSFGPAVEIPQDDFDRMWAAATRRYRTLEVSDADSVTRRRASAAPYRGRTTEERAAQLWVQGTVRATLAMAPEAEQSLRAALALPGLGPGYEHLVQLDLGAVLIQQKRYGEAIIALQRAAALVPENPRGWELLADAAGAAGNEELADEAAGKATKTRQVSDRAGLRQRLDEAIPADVWLYLLSPVRGWGVTPLPDR
jgi:hypothetical protein